MLALAALVTLCALPALSGDWVYDDWTLLDNPLTDGADDVLRAPLRHSGEYIARMEDPDERGFLTFTWRPASMLSLVAVHAASPRPLPHHLLSLLLHLGIVAALLVRLRARDGATLRPGSLVVLALVALHPAFGESWLWINGRSDVLAGLALAWLAVLLLGVTAERKPSRWGRAVVALLIVLVGAGAKETFVPAAGVVALCALADAGRRKEAVGVLVGLLLFLVLRTLVLPPSHGLGGTAQLVLAGGLLERVPQVLALGGEGLLLPAARPMRSLAWELGGPWGIDQALALGVGLVGLGWAIRARSWRAVLLLVGAAACLAPTAHVASTFWAGLDRYLVMPGLLTVLAVLEILDRPGRAPDAAPAPAGRATLAAVAALLLVAWSGFSLASTAGFYASQERFVWSMVERRPEDPTGYLFVAGELAQKGMPDLCGQLLDQMPDVELPPAHLREKVRLLLLLGRVVEAAELVEAGHARSPEDPWLALTAVVVRLGRRDMDGARALADRFTSDPTWCVPARAWIHRFLTEDGATPPPELEAAAARLFEGGVCSWTP
jgi:hypothetical protein